ncbi:MAG: ATP-grasp domain-containing protein [Actinobacteria bacterium]|nr:ATP-grasp domain-containing protein [Actinomycetota bacterium]
MERLLILLPSTGYRAGAFLDAARALGVEVIVGCDEPPVLSGTAKAVEVALADPDAAARSIVEIDAVTPLDAIVAVDDQGVVAAAEGSAQLGLRYSPRSSVEAAIDKLAMRKLLDAAEVRQPEFSPLRGGASLDEVDEAVGSVGLPCVIKPTCLSGSQGVIRADTRDGARSAAKRVRSIADLAGVDASAPLLVERFVVGQEVAVEGILHDGDLSVVAVFDKPDPLEGPFFEESIYVTPSRLPRRDLHAVIETTRSTVRALGLTQGALHAELRVKDAKASLIEIAARSIGGMCSNAMRFGDGRSLEYLILAEALGRRVEIERSEEASGVLMLSIPRAGTFVGLRGERDALEVDGITGVDVRVAPGRPVRPVPEGDRYLGFVFARATSPDAVEAALREARDLIDVVVDGSI